MRWIFATITFWLIFVCSLSAWWMVFGMNTLGLLADAQSDLGPTLIRQQWMLFYEGSFLVLLQVLGALAMFYFTFQMYKQKAAKEKFFASFTHDLKTALFRLQLQVENIERKGSVDDGDISKVLAKTRGLNLHLENGLDSALGSSHRLFFEKINLDEFISDLHAEWPELQIGLKGKGVITADKKALKSIFVNLLHNSIVHGQADKVSIDVDSRGSQVVLSYQDNGSAWKGKIEDLPALGLRPIHSAKGSGFGLFLVRYWIKRLRAEIEFRCGENQALVFSMTFPGAA